MATFFVWISYLFEDAYCCVIVKCYRVCERKVKKGFLEGSRILNDIRWKEVVKSQQL